MNKQMEVQKKQAIDKLNDGDKCMSGMQGLLDILIPQVYGKMRGPIECKIQSFASVDNARHGHSILKSHLKWLRDLINNLLTPRPEMFNILSRSAEKLIHTVDDELAERIGRLSDMEKMRIQKRFELILQNTCGNRIEELKRQIDGLCPCCGGMGRIPYGCGIPDCEEYDLCPVCHWEKIADVLKGKTRRVDESA